MAEFVSLSAGVEAVLSDGCSVAMEGFTHLIPHAAGHEAIRQGRKRLTLIRMTPDLIYDQMIGMGCAEKLVFSWGGNPGVGSLHRFRDAVENGWPHPLEIEEHSHAAMANAYEAGRGEPALRGLPRLQGRRPAEGQSDDPLGHLPLYRRGAGDRAGDPAGCRDHPRAAGPTARAMSCSRASSACRRRRCWPRSARSSRSRRSSTISARATPMP